MATLREQVGALIRHHRRELGWTQDVLAEKTGRSVEMINRLERGKTAPSFETLEALAAGFDIPIRDLFGLGPFAVREDTDPMGRLLVRIAGLDPEDIDWLDRLVSVALNRKVRPRG